MNEKLSFLDDIGQIILHWGLEIDYSSGLGDIKEAANSTADMALREVMLELDTHRLKNEPWPKLYTLYKN